MTNNEEKSSSFFGTLKVLGSSAIVGVASAIVGLSGRSKDDDIIDVDDDSMGPVMEDGEEISEVMFQSLLDTCSDDSVVVRSVRCFIFRSSPSFDILGFTS